MVEFTFYNLLSLYDITIPLSISAIFRVFKVAFYYCCYILSKFNSLGNLILMSFAFYWKFSFWIISSIVGLFSSFFYKHFEIISANYLFTVTGIGVYFSFNTLFWRSSIVVAKYGYLKVHSSYKITPKHHISDFLVHSLSSQSSGAK